MITKKDLTVIYYTSNYLDDHNPHFLKNTKEQLIKAIGDLPLISVSQKPMNFGTNICVGDIGRTHLNIYRQILIGAKAAKTKYVAMAEDDILYSFEHFHTYLPEKDRFAYNMCKWSIYSWTNPPMYSFKANRVVVNSLICKRDQLVSALEERFKKFEELLKKGKLEEDINHIWGDPGRYEKNLGVTIHETEEFWTTTPNIVFSHPDAVGYGVLGTRKRLGDLRATEIPVWGKAEDILKLWKI